MGLQMRVLKQMSNEGLQPSPTARCISLLVKRIGSMLCLEVVTIWKSSCRHQSPT